MDSATAFAAYRAMWTAATAPETATALVDDSCASVATESTQTASFAVRPAQLRQDSMSDSSTASVTNNEQQRASRTRSRAPARMARAPTKFLLNESSVVKSCTAAQEDVLLYVARCDFLTLRVTESASNLSIV